MMGLAGKILCCGYCDGCDVGGEFCDDPIRLYRYQDEFEVDGIRYWPHGDDVRRKKMIEVVRDTYCASDDYCDCPGYFTEFYSNPPTELELDQWVGTSIYPRHTAPQVIR